MSAIFVESCSIHYCAIYTHRLNSSTNNALTSIEKLKLSGNWGELKAFNSPYLFIAGVGGKRIGKFLSIHMLVFFRKFVEGRFGQRVTP